MPPELVAFLAMLEAAEAEGEAKGFRSAEAVARELDAVIVDVERSHSGVWDDFFDAPGVDLGERDQPEAETREDEKVVPVSDDQTPAWAKAMEARLMETLVSTRTAIMERIDLLQTRMDDHADRILGAVHLAGAADATAAGADSAGLERDLARSRAMAALSAAVVSMQRQIASLEAQLRELRDGKPNF